MSKMPMQLLTGVYIYLSTAPVLADVVSLA